MTNEFYIYLSIFTPLIAFFITPLLSSSPNLRDSLGPIGGIVTFYSSLNIASLYLDGEILNSTFFQILPLWFLQTLPKLLDIIKHIEDFQMYRFHMKVQK